MSDLFWTPWRDQVQKFVWRIEHLGKKMNARSVARLVAKITKEVITELKHKG
jgi:hypothetical protein